MADRTQFETSAITAVTLEEYNGVYSLSECVLEPLGPMRKQWCLRQIGYNRYSETPTPIKVTLGDESSAIRTLLVMLEEITGTSYVPVKG